MNRDEDTLSLSRTAVTQDLDVQSTDAAEPGEDLSWRVRFALAPDADTSFEVDIRQDVVLGRISEGSATVDLDPYGALDMGISRRHLMLRPTPTHLFALDLGSTNGTWLNGRAMGTGAPHSLSDGDDLTLGHLQLVLEIIQQPAGQEADLVTKAELADVLREIAKAITSQLQLDEVFSRVLETSQSLARAGEVAIWLVDEESGTLSMHAQRGIEDEHVKDMRLSLDSSSAGTVIETGRPLRTSRRRTGELVEVKSDYMVEALLYVPLRLGTRTVGILMAAQREPGTTFSKREEEMLVTIADFAAIALHNASLYEQVSTSLDEKEVLLKEIHHRVKNNLQVISSMLNLQSDHTENPVAINALAESRDRVRVMALIHEKLYQSPNLSRIDFGEYIESLVSTLIHSQSADFQAISLHVDAEAVRLDLETAIPCGLIVNELVTNALKHAFQGRDQGEIWVVLRRNNGSVSLTVGDDGVGPPEGWTIQDSESLGLQLVEVLVRQLDGTLALHHESGTEVVITFSIDSRKTEEQNDDR